MGGKELNYQVVYRGEVLSTFRTGEYVFFQRPKTCGGGYWLGRTYHDCFWFESGIVQPTSLSAGISFIIRSERQLDNIMDFDDDFKLT